ncbi:MAG: hypothetical protein ICV84_05770 [Flavisolibacter sp.]|nr:hypothetical protein [Flavisolibacter sp.]
MNTSSGNQSQQGHKAIMPENQDLDINRGGQQNASANRGGTTDMDNDAIAGAGRDTRTERGSGISTKRGVTGSDYDGQLST